MIHPPRRSWLAVLLSCILVFTLVAPAMAGSFMPEDQAISLLREYNIVQGDQDGNLNLDKPITRAQLAKIVVYAMGRGELAPSLADAVSFADAKGHWAAGYIEMANRLDLVKGRTPTVFDPDAQVTNAEVYTILLRMVKREPAGPWSATTIMQGAASLGMVPNVPLDVFAGIPAIRGVVFQSLATALVSVPMPDGSYVGKKFLDNTPPTLYLDDLAAATNVDTLSVTGNVVGATSVTVNGQNAPLSVGRFSATIGLTPGANQVTVVAFDSMGNSVSETRTVSRSGAAARIEVTGETSVRAGQSIQLSAIAYDSSNYPLPASAVTAEVPAGKGTFNSATGTFTAGSSVGPVTIAFKAGDISKDYTLNVKGLASEATGLRIRTATLAKGLTINKTWNVQVEVIDSESNHLTYDEGRTITLALSGLTGASLGARQAQTINGVATFTISGTEVGNASLVATANGLSSAGTSVTFTTNQRIVLTTDQSSVVANGTNLVQIRATLQDENGNPIVNNTNEDIRVTLDVPDFDGYVGSQYLIIRRGASSSAGNDGELIAGYKTESITLTGTLTSNHTFSVVPVTVAFKEVSIGAASRFEMVGGQGTLLPGGGREVNLTVRVVDANGNTIPTANMAFRVKVSTSNNESLVGGVPNGLNVTLGDTALTPVFNADDGVVGRTTNGFARLTMSYNKSGIVTLEVVGATSTDEAYSDEGVADTAASGAGLQAGTSKITFADAVTQLKVRVDLPGARLTDQEVGVLPANGRGSASIKVYLLDAAGGWVPNSSARVTLTRDGASNGTRLTNSNPDTMTVTARNGVAEFPITSTQNVSLDTWKADANLGVGKEKTIVVATEDTALDQPTILNITGDTSHIDNRVTVDDSGAVIDIAGYSANTYGYVKVFRSGSSTPIYTSDVLDLSSSPWILVPKSAMPNSDRYSISINNGYGDSVKSYTWPADTAEKVVVEKPVAISITAVRYDASVTISGTPHSQLIVSARGVQSNGNIDESKLSFYQTVSRARRFLDSLGADCKPSSGSFTCTFATDDVLDPDLFNGSVILDTESGWYTRDAYGETAGRDETISDNRVVPTAYLDYATVTFGQTSSTTTGVLSLYGTNLTQGRINLNKIKVDGLSVGTTTVSPTSSTKVDITLPTATAQALKNSATTVTVDAEAGWLYANSSDENASLAGIPVYVVPKISTVSYNASTNTLTITGTGFTGATIDATKLLFVDRRGAEITALDSSGLPTAVSATGDTTFSIALGSLGDSLEGGTYNGTVYLSSVEVNGTNGYWYTNGNGWRGATMGRYRLSW